VDGLAGSGKSTTAQRLWIHLTNNGYDAEWFHEHDPSHPIFYFGALDELPRLECERFLEQIVANWEALARDVNTGPIRILEGSLLQLPAGILLSKGVSTREIRAIVLKIAGLLQELYPLAIYLRHPDAEAWFLRNVRNRKRQWIDRMTALLLQTPYGERRTVRDVSVLMEFYHEQQVIVESIFQELQLRKTAVDVDDDNWETSYRKMAAFLKMGRLKPLALTKSQLLAYPGSFRGETMRKECRITAHGSSLYVQVPGSDAPIQLLPVRPLVGEFCLRAFPISVHFENDGAGVASGFTCDIRVPDLRLDDEVWSRTPH
jgi:hypothetical protein